MVYLKRQLEKIFSMGYMIFHNFFYTKEILEYLTFKKVLGQLAQRSGGEVN
jgi:hypothetical protein